MYFKLTYSNENVIFNCHLFFSLFDWLVFMIEIELRFVEARKANLPMYFICSLLRWGVDSSIEQIVREFTIFLPSSPYLLDRL